MTHSEADIEQAARAEAKRRGIVGEGFPTFIAGASWLAEYLPSDESVENVAAGMFEAERYPGAWREYRYYDDLRGIYRQRARVALIALLGKAEDA